MSRFWPQVVLGTLGACAAMVVVSGAPLLAVPIIVVGLIVFVVQVRRSKR